MKRISFLMLALVLAVVGVTVPLQAQTTDIGFTTLSAAATAGASTIRVTSATGFTASSGTLQYVAFVDKEAMLITGVSGTTITVQRGFGQTLVSAHLSGATTYVGASGSVSAGGFTAGPFVQSTPMGTCSRSGITLPLINIRTAKMVNCLGGQWYEQTMPDDVLPQASGTVSKYCTVPLGSVAYGSLGTSTTFVAGTIYRGSVWVPATFVATGVRILANGTVATDKILGALYDPGGTLLANAAVAGVTTSGANTFQTQAFTATKIVTGPARYFIAAQGNGTTDGIRTVAASTFVGIVAASGTGTFGTLASFTAPTTFTADTSPIGCIY